MFTSTRTSPAPPGTTPRISRAQASAIAESSPYKGYLTDRLDAELVLYTNRDIPPAVVAENAAEYGPDPGAVQNRLTWLLTYSGSPPTGLMHTNRTCDLILAVDADDGSIIDADHVCDGPVSRAK